MNIPTFKRATGQRAVPLVVTVLFILLLSSSVLSLGIRPAKTDLVFGDDSVFAGEFWVVNNNNEDIEVTVSVEGELSSFVHLDETAFRFRSDDDAKAVRFTVDRIASPPPGLSTATIIVEQKLAGAGGSFVESKIIVKHKLMLQGSYPEEYVVPQINFHEDANSIRFVSEVQNKGSKDVSGVMTTFYVNDEKTPQTLSTETTSLKTGEDKVLVAHLAKDALKRGEYEVSAVTTFGDSKVEVQKKLILGEPEIEVTYFEQYLKAHAINEMSLELLNHWNTLIENVFVEIVVLKDDKQVDSFRTKSFDLPALMRQKIKEYYDARNKDAGSYVFNVKVNYWNTYAQKEQTFKVEMLDAGADVGNGATGSVVATNTLIDDKARSSSGLSGWWIILGVMVVGIGGYVGYRYKHRDEYDDGSI